MTHTWKHTRIYVHKTNINTNITIQTHFKEKKNQAHTCIKCRQKHPRTHSHTRTQALRPREDVALLWHCGTQRIITKNTKAFAKLIPSILRYPSSSLEFHLAFLFTPFLLFFFFFSSFYLAFFFFRFPFFPFSSTFFYSLSSFLFFFLLHLRLLFFSFSSSPLLRYLLLLFHLILIVVLVLIIPFLYLLHSSSWEFTPLFMFPLFLFLFLSSLLLPLLLEFIKISI